jgi:AP endonuclease-2
MKTSRALMDVPTACPGKYDGFFSFPVAKTGYSGVAIYTNSETVTPARAEEGLTASIQPKPPLSDEERVSSKYPATKDMNLAIDENNPDVPPGLDELDTEGRALVLDLGLFVLINVYCPADSAETRYHFKLNFGYLLQERVRCLVAEGRDVLVVGDLNSCVAPIDYVEGKFPKYAAEFYNHLHRIWIRDWVQPGGEMIDILRHLYPDRRGMFTCESFTQPGASCDLDILGWNTRIQARETNYGARIDYILATPGLLPWVKGGDIQAAIKGSDHCPVYIDLKDFITTDSGETLYLRDQLMMPAVGTRKVPPRLCAKYWEECSQKQALLSNFFKKTLASASSASELTPSQPRAQSSCGPDSMGTPGQQGSPESLARPRSVPASQPPPATIRPGKRKHKQTDGPTKKKIKTDGTGQAKLSSFFSHPKNSAPRAPDHGRKSSPKGGAAVIDADSPREEDDKVFQKDILLAVSLSQEECDSSPIGPSKGKEKGKTAWSQLLAPIEAPLCDVHKEPAREYTVNKPGPNKGKRFFLCSRFADSSTRDICAEPVIIGRLVPDTTWGKRAREMT